MALPESLGKLAHLTHLDLRGNKLVAVPASLQDLPSLEKVDLRWNKIPTFPEWLQRLEQQGCTVYR